MKPCEPCVSLLSRLFCDQIYSIDAAHLKGSWNGVILVLSFKNSNNNVIHVASAVCAKENADAYTYLLRNAMKFEPMKEVLNKPSYTCFSDGHKGSASALPALCPLTEGRRCLQNVLKNIPAVEKVYMNFLVFPFQFIVVSYLPPYMCETVESLRYLLGRPSNDSRGR